MFQINYLTNDCEDETDYMFINILSSRVFFCLSERTRPAGK